jgi:SAM-dependent methyltransferase
MSQRLILPARDHIQRVDHSDPLPYYYFLPTAWLYRERLQMALDLLGPGPFQDVLEAGYGSGILLPSLTARARRVFAMDLHQRTDLVRSMLHAEGQQAELSVGTVTGLAFADASFDAVVCVSTMEHLHDEELEATVREFRRVLRPGGVAIVGVPASGVVMDLLFRAVGFSEIGDHHVSTRADIVEAMARTFLLEEERHMPAFAPKGASLYSVFRCRAA